MSVRLHGKRKEFQDYNWLVLVLVLPGRGLSGNISFFLYLDKHIHLLNACDGPGRVLKTFL